MSNYVQVRTPPECTLELAASPLGRRPSPFVESSEFDSGTVTPVQEEPAITPDTEVSVSPVRRHSTPSKSRSSRDISPDDSRRPLNDADRLTGVSPIESRNNSPMSQQRASGERPIARQLTRSERQHWTEKIIGLAQRRSLSRSRWKSKSQIKPVASATPPTSQPMFEQLRSLPVRSEPAMNDKTEDDSR